MTAIRKLLLAATKPVSIAPLVSFRIGFGLLMFFSLIRFWWRGWIDSVYVLPNFHFTYWGFEWVKPFNGITMHILFLVVAFSALFIALGFFYRLATIVFFLGFTYIELIDVTTYLNHYYFISLVAFLLIWLPAGNQYSIDVWRKPRLASTRVALWNIGIIRFQMALVYIFAGLAKINGDWLLRAEPMRTWLPAKSHLPIVGPLMYDSWTAYFFSWFGAFYDLFIVFFLLNKRTRPIAYLAVVVFHLATAIFFPAIGMFPYVMIVSGLIFFSGEFHQRLLSKLPYFAMDQSSRKVAGLVFSTPMKWALGVYMIVQVVIPLRYVFYPDNLFWNEEGYRFSWRVMLMEKAGVAYFKVTDQTGAQYASVNNREYLTPLQEKMMSTQPDLILKYAHHLRESFSQKGWEIPKVYAEVYVTLNGRPSTLFIDSTVNLAAEKLSWRHYRWILPFKDNH